MKVIAVVPIKLNNERLKNKNIMPFDNGEPLCKYILNTLINVSNLDEVYVYCSNDSIKDYLPDGVKYLKRSESLDQSTTKINEVLTAFAHDIDADYYLLTHVTAPFVSKATLEAGIDKVLSGEYDSAFSVTKIQDFMWKNNKPFNYQLDNIPRTQDLEPLYMETSGMYIFDKKTILEKNRRIGDKPCMIEVSQIEAIDIDEEEDFQIANAIYNFKNKLK